MQKVNKLSWKMFLCIFLNLSLWTASYSRHSFIPSISKYGFELRCIVLSQLTSITQFLKTAICWLSRTRPSCFLSCFVCFAAFIYLSASSDCLQDCLQSNEVFNSGSQSHDCAYQKYKWILMFRGDSGWAFTSTQAKSQGFRLYRRE